MQNKNLKLKLGLCGLALTSFLVVNAHSVVHADTVSDSNSNNNVITWDSDSDDSQVVKEEPEQEKVSQSVQKQVPVQSHVQVSYSQPVQTKKVMVSDVSSTSVSQKRAETSIVRQSNVETSTVNRLNANVARNNQVKVANVHATAGQHVQISNPQNNQVIVHYVKSNGQSAGLADQTIDLSNIKYNTTAVNKGGYLQLRKPYDKTTDPNGTDLLSDNADKNIGVPLKTSSANKLANVFNTNDKGNVQVSGADNVAIISIGNKTSMDNPIDNVGGKYLVSIRSVDHCYMFTSNSVNNVTANDIVSNYIDTGGMITDEVSSANQLTKQECADLENWVIQQDPVSINTKTVPVLKIYKDNITNSKIGMGKYNIPVGYTLAKGDGQYNVVNTPMTNARFTVAVHEPYQNPGVTDDVFLTGTEGTALSQHLMDLTKKYSKSLTDGATFNNVTELQFFATRDSGTYDSDQDIDYTFASAASTEPNEIGNAHVEISYTGKYSNGRSFIEYVKLTNADSWSVVQPWWNYNKKANGTGYAGEGSFSTTLFHGNISGSKDNYVFTDDGSAKSSVGNVVNVAVTQPVSVNDASQTRKTAERIISVNLPDDQGVRDRYKGILNDKDQIVQTITFTRTMTKDNLTGAVLSQSAWQGPSSFPAVTLPDIPGYTMTMS